MLLKEPATRRVLKEGIKYAGERYWHPELSVLVGEDVLVRAAPHYTAPEEIEVFSEGRWRCTAFAFTSPQGQALERQVVVEAQRRQRAQARSRIKSARDVLEMLQTGSHSPLTSSASMPKQVSKRQPTYELNAPDIPPATHQPDLFDFLVAQQADHSDRNNSKGEPR